MGTSARRTAALLLLVTTGVAACGRAVTVQVPDAEPGPDSVAEQNCREFHDQLPDSMAGERRLTVQPVSPQTAAWGAPAIVWRCGVAEPVALRLDSQLIEVNGTPWLPEELESGVRFTSVTTNPRIELTVPSVYPAPAGLLTELQTPDPS